MKKLLTAVLTVTLLFGSNLFAQSENVNIALTDFINMTYNRNYESVPFSEVNYFQSYHPNSARKYLYYHDNYEHFHSVFFDPEDCQLGSFNNKLVIILISILSTSNSNKFLLFPNIIRSNISNNMFF